MKNFTQILTLGLLATATVPAMAEGEFQVSDFRFPTTHRTAPAMADFSNNDKLDIIYAGQGNENFNKPGWWWQMQQNICYNNGDGSWNIDGYNYNERQETDENGNPIFNEDGSPKMAYDRVWSNHGIRAASYNQYAVLDYNNDGLVDVLLMGRKEWDIFDNGEDDNFVLLYKNLGNGKFELEANAVFPTMNPDNLDKDAGRLSPNYAIAVGDYDRDGYVDIAISATNVAVEENHPGRTVSLYRNIDGTGVFKDMKIAETKGGVYTNEVKDGDNVIVEKKLLEGYFLPISGNVHLADINNDGWLDLICDGWADNNWDGVHNAGNTMKIYLNQEGKKFIDASSMSPAYESLRTSASTLADFDGDGYLDFFQTGWGNNWLAQLMYNYAGENETEVFDTAIWNADLGVDGTERCRQVVRDFNGDGLPDIYYSGTNDCQIYYANLDGSFTKGSGLPSYGNDGFAAIGDVTGNGMSDIFICGYGDNSGKLVLNNNEAPEAPAAPTNVKAAVKDGKLNITWEYDTDEAAAAGIAYNIFVKNGDKVYSLVPANPETGFVKVGYGRTVALRPNIKEYSIPATEGIYTVGVQAISTYNETYSAFTTATLDNSGIDSIEADDTNAPVAYYNIQGVKIDNPAKGQLVIKVQGNKASKVIF